MITDQNIIAFLTNVNKFGASLDMAPHDWLNPGLGYSAALKLPSGNAKGYVEVKGSGETVIAALCEIIKNPASSVIPIS